MYKITKLFQKNEESWATLQKCESKFMSKEYEVKIAEIFPIVQSSVTNEMNESEKDVDDNATKEDTNVIGTNENGKAG